MLPGLAVVVRVAGSSDVVFGFSVGQEADRRSVGVETSSKSIWVSVDGDG